MGWERVEKSAFPGRYGAEKNLIFQGNGTGKNWLFQEGMEWEKEVGIGKIRISKGTEWEKKVGDWKNQVFQAGMGCLGAWNTQFFQAGMG